jgi:hypothetical protein
LVVDLKAADVREMTPKFWALHSDPLLFRDISAMTNITIQYNPMLGTLLDLCLNRHDLDPLIDDLLAYRAQ